MPFHEGELTYDDKPTSRYADQDRCVWVTGRVRGEDRLCRNAGRFGHRTGRYVWTGKACDCRMVTCERHAVTGHDALNPMPDAVTA